MKESKALRKNGHQAGNSIILLMTESSFFKRISAYMDENEWRAASEAEIDSIIEVNEMKGNGSKESPCEENEIDQRLDAIYDTEPLGFEKDPTNSGAKMLAQDPLEEVNLGDDNTKRVTYISAKLSPSLKQEVIEVLKKNKDCFAWDYDEMPGLKRELVEHRLPIKDGKKPIKQTPRRFAPAVLTKIKAKIERLLRCRFIRTTRYVEWLANIVPVIKKNGSLRICIDFRDLNTATPKDQYSMPVAEMLIDSAAGFEYLSMLDGYSGYNQIFIAEEDVAKTAFRCPGALGTYEWVVMPFGLKNAGATYQRAMNSIFHDFIETFMQVYIDDIVIKSISAETHLHHLSQSFERMRKHGLKMNPLNVYFLCRLEISLALWFIKKESKSTRIRPKLSWRRKHPHQKGNCNLC